MKSRLPLVIVFLLSPCFGFAQVASHAPTPLKPPAAPAPAGAATGDKPVARVNGVVLTQNDLLREEYAIFPYARQHGGAMPKEMEPAIRAGALKMIVFEELVYQEAMRRKMTIAPARMQKAEADFRKQFPNPGQFDAFVQSDFHGSMDLLRTRIRRSLLIEALLKIEVESKSIVTPEGVRAYYDHNPATFHHPETYTFQTISVLPPDNATPQQLKEGRKRADDAYAQARLTKNAEQFGLLAEKLSDDDYRVVMGQHKPLPVDQMAPEVVSAFQKMKPGDITNVIQLGQAYTIVRLEVHTLAGETPFAEVKANLQKQMHDKKKEEAQAAFDKKLRASATVEEM